MIFCAMTSTLLRTLFHAMPSISKPFDSPSLQRIDQPWAGNIFLRALFDTTPPVMPNSINHPLLHRILCQRWFQYSGHTNTRQNSLQNPTICHLSIFCPDTIKYTSPWKLPQPQLTVTCFTILEDLSHFQDLSLSFGISRHRPISRNGKRQLWSVPAVPSSTPLKARVSQSNHDLTLFLTQLLEILLIFKMYTYHLRFLDNNQTYNMAKDIFHYGIQHGLPIRFPSPPRPLYPCHSYTASRSILASHSDP
jgi:hypothetical protein